MRLLILALLVVFLSGCKGSGLARLLNFDPEAHSESVTQHFEKIKDRAKAIQSLPLTEAGVEAKMHAKEIEANATHGIVAEGKHHEATIGVVAELEAAHNEIYDLHEQIDGLKDDLNDSDRKTWLLIIAVSGFVACGGIGLVVFGFIANPKLIVWGAAAFVTGTLASAFATFWLKYSWLIGLIGGIVMVVVMGVVGYIAYRNRHRLFGAESALSSVVESVEELGLDDEEREVLKTKQPPEVRAEVDKIRASLRRQ